MSDFSVSEMSLNTGSSATLNKTPPVSQAFSRINLQVSALESLVKDLLVRLSPITTPHPEDNLESTKAPREGASEVTVGLNSIADQLTNLATRMSSITRNLEL